LSHFQLRMRGPEMPARSTRVFFKNETSQTLFQTSASLDHGAWTNDIPPPQTIAPGTTGYWESESDGVATGDEGRIQYAIGAKGSQQTFYLHWDNPFSGQNKYNLMVSSGYQAFRDAGAGQNADVNIVFRPAIARTSGFLPSLHGFRFENNFGPGNVPYSLPPLRGSVLDLKYGNARNGLCGGMTDAARDYFQAKIAIPSTRVAPLGEQDPLFIYLVNRLFATFDVDDVSLYLKYMDPAYPDTDENLLNSVGLADGRASVVINTEWPMIRADIDSLVPSPLGLVTVKSVSPGDLGKCHQVLAYGYLEDGMNVTLNICDPNKPLDDTVTIKFNTQDWSKPLNITYDNLGIDGLPVYCFFRTHYTFQRPPVFDPPPQSGRNGPLVRIANHVDVFWAATDGSVRSVWWDVNANHGNWNAQFNVAPPGSAVGGPVVSVARLPNHIDVFWAAPDGSVRSAWWDVNANHGNWNAPFNIAPPGSAVAGPVCAIARTPDHIDVFWAAPDGSVRSAWWDQNANHGGWNAPFNLAPAGSAVAHTVVATARVPDHLDVYWVGPDGAVRSAWWDPGANSGKWNTPFTIAPPGSAVASPVMALIRIPNHADLFWAAPDGSVRTAWWDAALNHSNWNAPFSIAPPGSAKAGQIAALARVPDHIDVFWTAPDGSVRSAWWDQNANKGNWNPPFSIAPPRSAVGDPIALARFAAHMDLFWAAPDGSVRSAWWDQNANHGNWNAPFDIAAPGSANMSVAAIARLPNHMDVFWAAPDGSVRSAWWDQNVNAGKWNAAFDIAPPKSAAGSI
jgi:hypothetical protein